MRRCGVEGEPPPAPPPPPSAAVTAAATGGSERGERAGRPSNAEWSRMGSGDGRGSWGRCVCGAAFVAGLSLQPAPRGEGAGQGEHRR